MGQPGYGMRWLQGAVLAVSVAVAGCGTVQFVGGAKFDPALLGQSLKPGSANEQHVRAALGEPYGRGRAMMPFHDSPRSVWTYYFEEGSADLGGGGMNSRRVYLFVFFVGDKLDGYMWFNSAMSGKL